MVGGVAGLAHPAIVGRGPTDRASPRCCVRSVAHVGEGAKPVVGAELRDQAGFGGRCCGVVGDAPSHHQIGVVGQLLDASPAGVTDRFTGA